MRLASLARLTHSSIMSMTSRRRFGRGREAGCGRRAWTTMLLDPCDDLHRIGATRNEIRLITPLKAALLADLSRQRPGCQYAPRILTKVRNLHLAWSNRHAASDCPVHAGERLRAYQQLHRDRRRAPPPRAPGRLRRRGILAGQTRAAWIHRGPGQPRRTCCRRAGRWAVLEGLHRRDGGGIPQADD